MRSVGVQGDGRTYDYTLALRAVTTTDFMTADWARIPYDVLDRISVRIVNEVPHIKPHRLRYHKQTACHDRVGMTLETAKTRMNTGFFARPYCS